MSADQDNSPGQDESLIEPAMPAARRSRQARVVWGSRVVTVGGDAPVRVQSMTNTDTVDAIGTAIQVKELAQAGSELHQSDQRSGRERAGRILTRRFQQGREARPKCRPLSGGAHGDFAG